MQYDEEQFVQVAKSRGAITDEQVNQARTKRSQMSTPMALGALLVRLNFLSREQHDDILREMGVYKIPNYELIRVIGRDLIGTLFLAKKNVTGEKVEVKILEPDPTDETFQKRFSREANAAMKIRHANIVSALEVGKAGDIYYFVCEHFEGKTAADLLKEAGKVDEQTVLKILAGIASALDAIERERLIHRDIKPENILITSDGQVKLRGLGLAKRMDDAQALTMPGVVLGAPDYLSPEQVTGGQPLDIRSDLYMLGATAYHLATGQLPWKGATPMESAMQRVQGKLVRARGRNPQVSESLDRIIWKAMQRDASYRYQTSRELLGDVERALQGKPLAAAPVNPTSAAARPAARPVRNTEEERTRKATVVSIIIGIIIAAVAVVALLFVLKNR